MLPKQTIHISSAAPYLPDDEISGLLLAVEELTHGVCRAGVVRDHSRPSRLPFSEAIIEYRLSGPDSPKELTIRLSKAPGPHRGRRKIRRGSSRSLIAASAACSCWSSSCPEVMPLAHPCMVSTVFLKSRVQPLRNFEDTIDKTRLRSEDAREVTSTWSP